MGHSALPGLVIGVVAGVALWAVIRDKLPRARMWMILLVGTVTAGLLGVVALKVAYAMIGASTALTGRLIGVSAGTFIAAIFAAELWHVGHPRRGTGGNRFVHSVMAYIAPSVFMAVGGLFAVALGMGTDLFASFSQAATSLFGA